VDSIGFAALRYRDRLTSVLPDRQAATGVAAVGLVIVGLATSQGIQTQLASNPARLEEMLLRA
jgi:glycerol uptake facilitator-like aquaporin